MPYEGEYATYRPLHRISECQRVKGLLARSKVLEAASAAYAPRPVEAPPQAPTLPRFILAIDGSFSNVLGLPLELLCEILKSMGLREACG